MSSDLWFNFLGSLHWRMINFSVRHKSHFLAPVWYFCALFVILHIIFASLPASRSSCMNLDNDVEFFLPVGLKSDLCWLYLCLNVPSVIPWYTALTLLPFFTVALYTIASVRHLFCSGHAGLSRQLHLLGSLSELELARIFLL